MIISTDEEKHLKNPTCFHEKTVNKLGTEEMNLNIIKAMYDYSIATIILYGESLKIFPLRQEQGYPLSPLTLNMLLELLTRTIK